MRVRKERMLEAPTLKRLGLYVHPIILVNTCEALALIRGVRPT